MTKKKPISVFPAAAAAVACSGYPGPPPEVAALCLYTNVPTCAADAALEVWPLHLDCRVSAVDVKLGGAIDVAFGQVEWSSGGKRTVHIDKSRLDPNAVPSLPIVVAHEVGHFMGYSDRVALVDLEPVGDFVMKAGLGELDDLVDTGDLCDKCDLMRIVGPDPTCGGFLLDDEWYDFDEKCPK